MKSVQDMVILKQITWTFETPIVDDDDDDQKFENKDICHSPVFIYLHCKWNPCDYVSGDWSLCAVSAAFVFLYYICSLGSIVYFSSY